MTVPEDLNFHLRRNPERGWIDLIVAAPDADEADRQLGAELVALQRMLNQDMSLYEALEVQQLATELEELRSDLRRTVILRRAPPPAPDEDEERAPDETPEGPQTVRKSEAL